MIDIRDIFKKTDEYAGKKITVGGWVRTVRSSKAFGFIELNDGTFFSNLQIVFEDGIVNDFRAASKLTVGSAISCTGTLELTPGAKQPFEI